MVNIYDLRVWDQYYSEWKPLAGIQQIQLSKTGDFAVDTGQITAPGNHPLSRMFLYVRVAPVPITWEMNGEVWTGQIEDAQRKRQGTTFVWELSLKSDDKHLQRLLARSPNLQEPTDVTKANLGQVMHDLVAQGATRTGLPVYIQRDADGPVVEVEARTENTVGDLLQGFIESSDVFAEVRMLLPGQTIPGVTDVKRIVGPAESRWISAMLAEGHWPHAQPDVRIKGGALSGDIVLPPDRFTYSSGAGHLGQASGSGNIAWNPFDSRPLLPEDQRDLYYRDWTGRSKNNATRRATLAQLQQLANTEDRQHFGVFVTQWQAGAWAAKRDLGLLEQCAEAGLLMRADGVQVGVNDLDDLHAWIGTDAAWAWKQGQTWVVANRATWTVESNLRKANATGSQRQIPGVLVRLFPGRERREIVLSTSHAGGLDSWEASIKAPDGAAVVTAVQHDQWVTDLMASGGFSDAAKNGARRKTAQADADGRVTDLTTDVLPGATADASEIAFGSVAAGVDLSVAGPFFYRERFLSVGNNFNADLASQLESLWSEMQGGTALTLTTAQTRSNVFGADMMRDDGTVCPGWRIGDRIIFIDEGTQITEVINGWQFTHNVGEPPKVAPVLGKRINRRTPLDELVETAREAQKKAQANALSPAKRLGKDELVNIIETEYGNQFNAWGASIDTSIGNIETLQGNHDQNMKNLKHIIGNLRNLMGEFKKWSTGEYTDAAFQAQMDAWQVYFQGRIDAWFD